MVDEIAGKPNKLLMVVTFRHYFIGLGLALQDKASNYHLVFINQKYNDNRNPIYQASLRLSAPFSSVSCLPLNVSGLVDKLRNRKRIFSILERMIDELKPIEIATGNDRRIEYQYAMHYARNKLGVKVVGGYLDNGIGSYINFQKLEFGKFLARKWLDVPLKKIVYGRWYTRMQRYGGSDWTDVCYLTHPQYAPSRLLRKECRKVNLEVYKNDSAHVINQLLLLLGLGGQTLDNNQSILLVLPKAPVMKIIYGSIESAERIVKKMCEQYKNVYVKYHPADLGDVLQFNGQAVILPSQLPVELLFLGMSFCKVVGDGSTAILSAKWMLPDADVGFFDLNTPYTHLVKDIFIDSGIRPISVN